MKRFKNSVELQLRTEPGQSPVELFKVKLGCSLMGGRKPPRTFPGKSQLHRGVNP